MVNVLVFAKIALENGRGGEVFNIELASGLSKRFNVDLLETNVLLNESLLSNKEIKKRLGGIKRQAPLKFAQFRIFNKNFTFPYPGSVIKLLKGVKKNDVVYAGVGNFKVDFMLMIFSLLVPQTKFLIGYHKPLHSEKRFSLYNLKYRASILFYSLFKKNIYHHTISIHTKKYLENFIDSRNIKFLIEGLELDKYIINVNDKKEDDILKFAYVGFLDDIHKGVGVLLEAIEEFLDENKDLKIFFEIIGVGPLESEVKRLEKKFPNYIRSIGYLTRDDLADSFKRNDVFLFSSRKEPFGRVIIEALAAKLIIICTRTIGSIEILRGKDFAFFLESLSVQQFKDKFKEIYNLWLANPEYIKKLQSLASEFAIKKYSISEEIEAFTRFIEKL